MAEPLRRPVAAPHPPTPEPCADCKKASRTIRDLKKENEELLQQIARLQRAVQRESVHYEHPPVHDGKRHMR